MHPKWENQKALYENKIGLSGLAENTAIDQLVKRTGAVEALTSLRTLRVLAPQQSVEHEPHKQSGSPKQNCPALLKAGGSLLQALPGALAGPGAIPASTIRKGSDKAINCRGFTGSQFFSLPPSFPSY